MSNEHDIKAIVDFWLRAGPQRWFVHDRAFDAEIRQRFGPLQLLAEKGELTAWETTADGALARLLLLDQFPRNLHRNTPRAFSSDPEARAVAVRAIAHGFDRAVDPHMRTFFYLPLMHSEDLADQDRSVSLYEALGDPDSLKFAKVHRDIIARFGRFPHRNPVLGRATTPEEQTFLDDGGFKG